MLFRSPKVFLMDEPLSNLDAKLRVQMRTEISKLHHNLNTTFIYVTHDQTEALTMGTRIVVMKDGFIQQIDNPQTLYDEPINQFVAGFIGSPQMNFGSGVLLKEMDKMYLKFGEYRILLPENKAIAVEKLGYIGRDITFGIRPEDVHEVDDNNPEENPPEPIFANVEVTEKLGSETLLYVVINGINFTSRVSPKSTTQPDDEVKLYFDMNKIHLFDKDTEMAIVH